MALADSNSCTSCGSQDSCPTDENLTVKTENLEGFEELRAVTGAWTNEDTRLLMKELIWKDHCTPRLPGSEAQEITVHEDGEEISQSTVVEIPFKAHGNDLEAKITYSDNGSSEKAFATVAGTASVLEEPMGILKENARYQAIVDNLEGQEYTVKEESAQVIKTYIPADYASVPDSIKDEVWNITTINVKAVKGDQVKYITALVCIDKGRVLIIRDSWCEIGCHIACGVGCAAACTFLSVTTIVFAGVAFECFELCHILGCISLCDYVC